jgi:hypothetical protein
MNIYSAKYFGEIDLDGPNQWYETELNVNNKTVEVLFTVLDTSTSIDKEAIQKIEAYLDNFQDNESYVRSCMQENFKQKGDVMDYIDFHIEEFDKEDIADLIKGIDKKLSKKEKLLSILVLLRIVFYPERDDGTFAVLDYTISEELTDELIAVKLYKDDTMDFAIES